MHTKKTKTKAIDKSRLIKLLIITVLISLIIFLGSSKIFAQGNSSARAVALGSAYTSLATGIDAARYNPANLGFESHQKNGLELAGVGANIHNNSFTLNDYNKYTGAYLTDADKTDILNKIPNEGLKLSLKAEASALGLSYGSMAFTSSGFAVAEANMNKDILNLILNGNTFADTINITGSYSEGYAYASFGLSFGKLLYKYGDRQFSVGSTIKYLKGFGIEKVVQLEGMAATYATGFAGQGSAIIHTATGGSGYAVDLGAALKINDKYTVGATIKNFFSSMTWNKDTEEHGYIFNFDTMTVSNMGADYITSNDYTVSIDDFKTTIPSYLNIGFAKTAGDVLWGLEWEQGFSSKTGVSSAPRFSGGVEWSPIKVIPLRTGYSTGGNKTSSFSIGSGFHFPVFYIDYAVVTGNSLSGGSSKAVNFAITTGLFF